MDENKSFMACVGYLSVALILGLISFITHGYVLYCLWGWFLVPLSLPAIGFFHAIGISATLRSLINTIDAKKAMKERAEEKDIALSERFNIAITASLIYIGASGFILLTGYILKHFI